MGASINACGKQRNGLQKFEPFTPQTQPGAFP